MKKLIFLFSLLIGSCIVPASYMVARPVELSMDSQCLAIHPRDLNLVLKAAASEWQMSLGAARQAYNAGNMTIQDLTQNQVKTYMVDYDGFCILVVLEDKL